MGKAVLISYERNGCEMYYEEKTAEKPEKWPANAREQILDTLCECVEEFKKNPSYKTREVLLSLTCEHDLNLNENSGLVRVTEYEVGILNFLYLVGNAYQISSLKTYIYNIITQVTRLQKITSWFNPVINCDEENTYRVIPYEQGLIFPLRLYHIVYQKFTIEKNKSFAEQLIEIVEETLKSCQTEEEIDTLTHSYTSMLLDISNMHGSKREKLWEFTREELYKLLAIEAKLLRMNKQPANIRPVKGVLMMMISNSILKSRNGYNNDYICKYLPIEVAKSSISNHQIWMKKTELLNDEREKKVIPELFEDMSWIHYDWIKDIDFSETRNYYVSCFSKSINNSHMQDGYGECLYGYKNDRIVDLIGPIGLYILTKKADADADLPDTMKRPYIAQVITFDVLYDIEEAKTELQYLFSVIDMFDLSDNNKKMFLQEILQYWILSVKDSKWKAERERRYVIFLYDDYEYIETELDDTFLKVKTSLFITPDFIIGKNPSKWEIMRQLAAKRKALFSKEYLFCENCLMQDHDVAIHEKPEKCPICGSKNIRMIYHENA